MTTFGSVREALAYMYSCRRGPRLAQPRYTDAPRSTGRTFWDHIAIAELLHGPKEQGRCGVAIGSELDGELERWALEGGSDLYSPRVRTVEDRMRKLLERAGMKRARRRPLQVQRFDFLDADGRSRSHLTARRLTPLGESVTD